MTINSFQRQFPGRDSLIIVAILQEEGKSVPVRPDGVHATAGLPRQVNSKIAAQLRCKIGRLHWPSLFGIA